MANLKSYCETEILQRVLDLVMALKMKTKKKNQMTHGGASDVWTWTLIPISKKKKSGQTFHNNLYHISAAKELDILLLNL